MTLRICEKCGQKDACFTDQVMLVWDDVDMGPTEYDPEDHEWRLETEGPEVFVAVCSVCGKRTTNPGVLLKLLDDFSPRRR